MHRHHLIRSLTAALRTARAQLRDAHVEINDLIEAAAYAAARAERAAVRASYDRQEAEDRDAAATRAKYHAQDAADRIDRAHRISDDHALDRAIRDLKGY